MASKRTLARLQQHDAQLQSEDMSLCFLKAFTDAKTGSITQQEYISNLVSHFRGLRHQEGEIPSVIEPLACFEPWVASLRDLALTSEYEPLEGKLAHRS